MPHTVEQPPLPAVPDYPTASPYDRQVEAAHRRFLTELEVAPEEWTEMGERQGVRLSKRYDEDASNPIPLSRGETVVEGVTPEAFLAGVVQLPGMRALWDTRTEYGVMYKRYELNTVLFYALTRGKRFLAKPRDMVGIQRNYAHADGSRTIIQTSVDAPEIPDQKGTTRATLKLSGWLFKPEGNNTRIIYLLDVALNGSIPNAIVSMATSESPLAVGYARDAFYKHGHAPYVHISADTADLTTIFQLESITTPPTRQYRCTVTTGTTTGEVFEILYDLQRMYSDGIPRVFAEGDEGALEVQDDGAGTLRVTTLTSGRTATVCIDPK